jgi:hypothetical protein
MQIYIDMEYLPAITYHIILSISVMFLNCVALLLTIQFLTFYELTFILVLVRYKQFKYYCVQYLMQLRNFNNFLLVKAEATEVM